MFERIPKYALKSSQKWPKSVKKVPKNPGLAILISAVLLPSQLVYFQRCCDNDEDEDDDCEDNEDTTQERSWFPVCCIACGHPEVTCYTLIYSLTHSPPCRQNFTIYTCWSETNGYRCTLVCCIPRLAIH